MTELQLTDSRITTGAATLHVEQTGEGTPALVFLHYWGGSTRTWHPVLERLAGEALCVAIDHRGWGRSTAPATGYATGDFADDALAVVTALDLADYVLVGHSMGGKVAQLLASRRPAGLRGVVLVAPAPAKPAPVPSDVRARMAASYDSRESILATVDAVLTHAPLGARIREQIVADSLAGAAPAKHEWPTRTITEDVSADLARIEVPVLVVAGEHDQVEPVDLLRSHVLATIPGARLEVIPGAGHLLPLERTEQLSNHIAAFRKRSDDMTLAKITTSDAAFRGDDPAPITSAGQGKETPVEHPIITDPATFASAFDQALNSGDLDRLHSLYDPDATMRISDGSVVHGHERVGQELTGLIAAAAQLENRTRHVFRHSDVALIVVDYTLRITTPNGRRVDTRGTATNVLRHTPGHGWRMIIANPPGIA